MKLLLALAIITVSIFSLFAQSETWGVSTTMLNYSATLPTAVEYIPSNDMLSLTQDSGCESATQTGYSGNLTMFDYIPDNSINLSSADLSATSTLSVQSVPEPSSIFLLSFALALIVGGRINALSATK